MQSKRSIFIDLLMSAVFFLQVEHKNAIIIELVVNWNDSMWLSLVVQLVLDVVNIGISDKCIIIFFFCRFPSNCFNPRVIKIYYLNSFSPSPCGG